MKRFQLVRDVDVSGVSGTGIVAEGVVWDNGKVAVHWFGQRQSIVQWDSLDDAIAIHGHGGATRFEWIDEDPRTSLTWDEMVTYIIKLVGLAAYATGMFRGYVETDNEHGPLIAALKPQMEGMDAILDEIMTKEKERGREVSSGDNRSDNVLS